MMWVPYFGNEKSRKKRVYIFSLSCHLMSFLCHLETGGHDGNFTLRKRLRISTWLVGRPPKAPWHPVRWIPPLQTKGGESPLEVQIDSLGCLARLYIYIMKQNSREPPKKPIGFKGRLVFQTIHHLGFWFFLFKTWSNAKGISALVCFATWSLKV